MQLTATEGTSSSRQRSSSTSQHRRVWEVDALRGIAIVMMVVYHFTYDLYFFGVSDAIFTDPFWFYFQRTTATLFIGLVGVSLILRQQQSGGQVRFVALVKRGSSIFLWGLLISVVTRLALGPAVYVRFGILHLIGVSVVLAYPFLHLRWLNLVLGASLIGVGIWLQQFTFERPWSVLFWLGLEPANHFYVDFFPLIRWFGVVLLGLFVGDLLYGPEGRKFPLPAVANRWSIRALTQMGRRSLMIYLLHQPVLLALLGALLFLLGEMSIRL